jgi:hypothetical protein
MKGGDGPHSYAQNSKLQAWYQYLFPILWHCLDLTYFWVYENSLCK